MRPYTICHMMASLEGRIDCDMTEQIDDTNHYYEALELLGCPSTLEGKTTLAMHYAQEGRFESNAPYKPAGKQVYKDVDADGYAIDGRAGMAAAFDGRPKNRKPVRLTFKSVEEKDGIIWMRYQVDSNK